MGKTTPRLLIVSKYNGMKKVTLYTDGACSGNPGPGGYGAILEYTDRTREISGGFRNTTNNRMEITAVLAGLTALKEPCEVTVFSDSRYVVDAVEKGWVRRWQAKGWMRNKTERALNVDLWKKLLPLLEKHRVVFRWIKGHSRHPKNERCDRLAVAASARPDLPEDKRED
jgi:ribonuclease HI